MKKIKLICIASIFFFFSTAIAVAQNSTRSIVNFGSGWKFFLGDPANAQQPNFDDGSWRKLSVPHDWSIEGEFSDKNPAGNSGGALPGGMGWYRKSFTVPLSSKGKLTTINFDGVYQKSDVWVNGHHLGFRPNGYISFSYDLSPFLQFGGTNTIAVKVDNSQQPNSRWYSGSGIYRNVWLVTTNNISIAHWGTFVITPQVSASSANVQLNVTLRSDRSKNKSVKVNTTVVDAAGKPVATTTSSVSLGDSITVTDQSLVVKSPVLWSVNRPYLYKVITRVMDGTTVTDEYTTPLGIRYFKFDADKGFSLNGKSMKLLGVCDHHDLGSLGAAVNYRALERQLQILKGMGVNAIRTSHNPPAPELLDLCDKMGFLVMDEAFDVWRRGKVKYDYHLFFDAWHERDLRDQILRDRNHPSVIMWSIGNEISEQSDTSALRLAPHLAAIVHSLDKTRPITAANNNPDSRNQIIQSGAVDLVGYNYHQNDYKNFHDRYPGKIFIGTETTSALETRGQYDMPSDSIRRWPARARGTMNADYTVSAYDNVSAPWGSTHEETWKEIKKYDFLSGMFIWTGFDYLGEPTPYPWPARSSYFGIIDLAGFPKDSYYMYQSEWTNTPVLHIFPDWNWEAGKTIDVWAYYNNADEVELYLNGKSLGIRKKTGEDLHVQWRVAYAPGTLKAVSRKAGKVVLEREIHTAGKAAKILLTADRATIKGDGNDLSFITVKVVDKDGNLVPHADNKINFTIKGNAALAAVDNGDPISHDSFLANYRKAFNGLALAIVKGNGTKGSVVFTASGEGLTTGTVTLEMK